MSSDARVSVARVSATPGCGSHAVGGPHGPHGRGHSWSQGSHPGGTQVSQVPGRHSQPPITQSPRTSANVMARRIMKPSSATPIGTFQPASSVPRRTSKLFRAGYHGVHGMRPGADTYADLFTMNYKSVRVLTRDVTEAEARRRPDGVRNPMLWIAGHVATYRAKALETLGARPPRGEGLAAVFGKDVRSDEATWPALASVLEDL